LFEGKFEGKKVPHGELQFTGSQSLHTSMRVALPTGSRSNKKCIFRGALM